MKLKDCRDIGDCIKFLKRKAGQQDGILYSIERIQNILLASIAIPTKQYKAYQKDSEGHTLIASVRIMKPEDAYRTVYVKLDLCKVIEPFKSKAHEYEQLRESAKKGDEDAIDATKPGKL